MCSWGEQVLPFVARLHYLHVDHAFLSRWGAVHTSDYDFSNNRGLRHIFNMKGLLTTRVSIFNMSVLRTTHPSKMRTERRPEACPPKFCNYFVFLAPVGVGVRRGVRSDLHGACVFAEYLYSAVSASVTLLAATATEKGWHSSKFLTGYEPRVRQNGGHRDEDAHLPLYDCFFSLMHWL